MRLLLGILLGAGLAGATRRSAEGEDATRTESEERMARMRHSAMVYELTRGEGGEAFSLRTDPVLRYSNPVSGTKDGAVFLWLQDGRPAAAMQVFINRLGETVQEFQSLSTESLRLVREDKVVWSPETAGVEFRPVPGAPEPAGTAAQRLRQMRGMLEKFEVTELAKVDFRDEERTPYVLRALPQPGYRYGKPDSEVLDGAVFLYVRGTDPEVLLLLEARQAAGGWEWQYALAPMTGYAASARYEDRQVWSTEERFFTRKPTDAWFATMFGP